MDVKELFNHPLVKDELKKLARRSQADGIKIAASQIEKAAKLQVHSDVKMIMKAIAGELRELSTHD